LKNDLKKLEEEKLDSLSDWAKKVIEIEQERKKELEKLEAEKNA
jgi:hypothetical protein